MLRTLKHLTLTASLLSANAACLYAQPYFVPPQAAEYIFGDPSFAKPKNTSCYSLEASYSYFPAMGFDANLYVAAWNSDDLSIVQEVTVLLTDPTNPSNVLWKTSIPYTHVQDLEVGSIRNVTTNNTNIVVAYYKEATGHMLDVYELTPNPSNPYNLVDHKVLSNSPTYGRIRMDFHATYDGAVAWVNTTPGQQGIQAMVYTNDTWSAKSTLNGTGTKTGLDIAITQSVNGSAYPLHFVYYGGGFITESTVDMNTLATTPGAQAPMINDNSYVGLAPASRLVLDCPDFTNAATAGTSSWAYTYSDAMNIVVRHYNQALGSAQTVAVTSGMLGNNPLDPTGSTWKVFSPAINYGGGPLGSLPDQIMVAWYATDGHSNNGYMALRMNTNGTMVTSTPDYLLLPNANTPSMHVGFTSGIALSKMGPKSVRDYLYATYYDYNYNTGEYQLHHAFHKFGDVVFKGGSTGLQATQVSGAKLNVAPNPFSDMLLTTVTLRKAGVLHLQLHDVTGRLVWQNTSTLSQGEHQIKTESLKGLTAGTYMLTATLDNQKADTKMVVKR